MNIKNQEELKIMEEGGQILAKILKEAKKNIKIGVPTLELDRFTESLIIRYHAKAAFKGFRGYPNSTCISLNEEIVHGLPSNKKIIKNGDIVCFDCGVLYKGFNTDAAFTVGVGKVSLKAQNLIDVTKKSLEEAIKIIKPNIHISRVQKIIQKTIESAGLSVIRSLSGHGIGKQVHESPSIYNFVGSGPNLILKPGMTFCLEPMATMGKYDVLIASDGWTIKSRDKSLAAHFEHTLAVTKSGCIILTK